MSSNITKSVNISGFEIHPIIEGGKGIGISNGTTAGNFAKFGACGTFSAVNPDRYDEFGNYIPPVYKAHTRKERHQELIEMGIEGGITQAKIAYDIAQGKGPIHMNILWEMGGAQPIAIGILEKAKGLINGVTCGAGMPYKIADIASEFEVFYYPIVSSMRAFRALWKRSYSKNSKWLGGVVYEDPWLAGGHNGLSTNESPDVIEDPYPRVAELRSFMNEINLHHVPIIMAGGVWHLKDWEHWFDNKEIGLIAFQFGTRPIVTTESPVSDEWKQKLLDLEEGDVFLNRFSPTGFYSSAVRNNFLQDLIGRSERQIEYRTNAEENFDAEIAVGKRGRKIYVPKNQLENAQKWMSQGFNEVMRTPDSTVIFVTEEKSREILQDQIDCMGCLSACKFSNWSEHGENNTTGIKADPRSFCIQKTLQDIAHGGSIDNNLMFSGHNAFKFKTDPFYANGFIPSIEQLINRIITGY